MFCWYLTWKLAQIIAFETGFGENVGLLGRYVQEALFYTELFYPVGSYCFCLPAVKGCPALCWTAAALRGRPTRQGRQL